jgi:hypothetical protein
MLLDQDTIKPYDSFLRFHWKLGNLDISLEKICCISYTHPNGKRACHDLSYKKIESFLYWKRN